MFYDNLQKFFQKFSKHIPNLRTLISQSTEETERYSFLSLKASSLPYSIDTTAQVELSRVKAKMRESPAPCGRFDRPEVGQLIPII